MEEHARGYVEKRFPRASRSEREKIILDWKTKEKTAAGVALDFERRVGPLQGLRILDAGSGPGGIGIAFARRGAKVEGVDIEKELVDISRAEAAKAGVDAAFSLYEGKALPFPDRVFDAALSISVIEHVDEPVRYLSEILRVVKPGGVLYLAFPNRLNPIETHTGLWFLSYMPSALARAYARIARRNPIEDNDLHFYTYWRIRRYLSEAGADGRSWRIREEKGRTEAGLKGAIKALLRAVGIPHQALLPHVMLIVEAS